MPFRREWWAPEGWEMVTSPREGKSLWVRESWQESRSNFSLFKRLITLVYILINSGFELKELFGLLVTTLREGSRHASQLYLALPSHHCTHIVGLTVRSIWIYQNWLQINTYTLWKCQGFKICVVSDKRNIVAFFTWKSYFTASHYFVLFCSKLNNTFWHFQILGSLWA